MATDKKGFILYADQKELFDQLPNDKAGELIKHIFSYVNDENPETNDLLLKLAFTPIKQQLKRDLKKFEEVKIKRSEAGKKSAEARRNKSQQTSTKSTSVKSVEQTSTKSTVKENVNVTVNDKEKDIKKESFDLFWSKYPNKVAKQKCKEKFLKLKEDEVKQILDTLDNFINYKPFESYNHPNPETYLNQKRWEDVITPKEKEKTKQEIYEEQLRAHLKTLNK